VFPSGTFENSRFEENRTMMKLIAQAQMGIVALAAILAAGLMAAPSAMAEEGTINAFAGYEGEGKVYMTGENKGTFVGAIVGELFIDSEKGPLHAGRIVCPGMMQLNLKTGEQAGSGHCTITAKDGGAQTFAVWSCRGVHLVGCNGKMLLTGGTGRSAGISGSGPLKVRTLARGMVKKSSDKDSVTTFGGGILVLRGFKYKKPAK
jgi:hypothetical protein